MCGVVLCVCIHTSVILRLNVGQYSMHGDFEVGVKYIKMSGFATNSCTGKAAFFSGSSASLGP